MPLVCVIDILIGQVPKSPVMNYDWRANNTGAWPEFLASWTHTEQPQQERRKMFSFPEWMIYHCERMLCVCVFIHMCVCVCVCVWCKLMEVVPFLSVCDVDFSHFCRWMDLDL